MNRKEKPAVPAAEYFVSCFKANKYVLPFFFFPLVVEDQFFWLGITQKRNSQARNFLEQAVSLQSSYGLLWIKLNNLSEL